jgi:PAB-dependent poly(A)-specific ribonuclease subunit 3
VLLGLDSSVASALSTPDYQDYEPYQYQDQSEHDGYDMGNPEMYHHYDQQPLESFYPEFLGPFVREPLNYHLYTNTIPRKLLATPQDSHFVLNSNELREILHQRSETTRSGPAETNLPEEVQGYHTIVPLQPASTEVTDEKRKYGTWPSTVYKAQNSTDGITYALRRVTNFSLTNQSAFASIDTWSSIKHPGIVSVIAAFTTRAFGDSSLFVVYAYHPGARTLADVHLKSNSTTGSAVNSMPTSPQRVILSSPSKTPQRGIFTSKSNANNSNPITIPEATLWSYVIQIASAMRAVHEVGLAVRQIEVSKVLVTGRNRIRIGACGMVDIILHETPQDIGSLQQDDFVMLGRLVVILCCNNLNAAGAIGFQKSVEWIGRTYGAEVKDLVMWLVKAPHKVGWRLLKFSFMVLWNTY